jgi:hypothetical protein
MSRLYAGMLGCWLLAGCAKGSAGAAAGAGTVRSPSLDYAAPAVATSDGETVGADRRGPSDKLHEGATTSGPAPGWSAGKAGLTFDPKRRTGGAIDPPPANGSSPTK